MPGKTDWAKYHQSHRDQRNQYVRDWCKKNPEKRFARYMRSRLKKHYGMTLANFNEMLAAQDGKCLICQSVLDVPSPTNRVRHGKSAVIDHDHKSEQVRAILCNNCNRALGLFNHDSKVMRNAIVYMDIFNAD